MSFCYKKGITKNQGCEPDSDILIGSGSRYFGQICIHILFGRIGIQIFRSDPHPQLWQKTLFNCNITVGPKSLVQFSLYTKIGQNFLDMQYCSNEAEGLIMIGRDILRLPPDVCILQIYVFTGQIYTLNIIINIY